VGTNVQQDRSRLKRRLALQLCLFVTAGVFSLIPSRAAVAQGQFLVQCREPVKSSADDPIVHPGHPGMSHLHEFYGNRAINPHSTYRTLIGQPTGCEHTHEGDEPGDTSAYWHPTLYVRGARVPATKSTFYYTNREVKAPGTMRPWPANLRVVAGDARAIRPQDTSVVYWGCGDGSSVSKVDHVPQCRSGDSGLTFHVIFPDCWDGRNLDSADHKSHMAYSNDARCPSSHPVSLPWLIMRIRWENFAPAPGDVTLSSGGAHTLHADFWNTWHQGRLEQLTLACINAGRKCDYADLDNLPFPAGASSTTLPRVTSTTQVPNPTTTVRPTTTTTPAPSTTTLPRPRPDAGGNLATNAGFELGLGGWESNEGTLLSRSPQSHTGSFSASLVRIGPAGHALLNDRPNLVATPAALCTASAWVRGPAGAEVKIRLREYRGGNRHASDSVSAPLTGSWQQVTVSVAPVVGGALDLDIYGRDFAPGQALLVDDVREVCSR
jgi:hypothetical protein